MKLNVGCGYDKRPGFINIDGNEMLEPDMVLCLGQESLLDQFSEGSIESIVANDIIEHLFHWQAMQALRDMHKVLASGGSLELRLPDFDAIITYPGIDSEEKIKALFGGQDRPQGEHDVRHRQRYPGFFCHKFAYTKDTMKHELEAIGFVVSSLTNEGTNMIVRAVKETE